MCIDDYFSYHHPIHDNDHRTSRPAGIRQGHGPSRHTGEMDRRMSATDMPAVPTPSQLSHIDDDELARLASNWRALAGRGDREAFGIAHALEVEQRRRTRVSQLQQLPEDPGPAPRPWWKFWQPASERNPTSAS